MLIFMPALYKHYDLIFLFMTRKIRVIARFNLMWGTLCVYSWAIIFWFLIFKKCLRVLQIFLILNVFFPWTLSECKKTNLKRSFWIDSFLFSFYWYFEVKIHKSKLLQKTNFKCRIICGDFYASGNLTRVRKRPVYIILWILIQLQSIVFSVLVDIPECVSGNRWFLFYVWNYSAVYAGSEDTPETKDG